MKSQKDFQEKFQEYKCLIDKRLCELVEKNCESQVSEAMFYSLNIGGKRVRPILTLAFSELCGCCDLTNVLDIACAIEMIHTYSLIHDDLPCMDNDELRRGKPACHIKFGQAIALLAGDALLTLAFEIIVNLNLDSDIKVKVIKIIASAIGYQGMILGQNLDINNINKNINIKKLDEINILKTGKLLRVAAVVGCIVMNKSEEQIKAASEYGLDIGLAFQIKDDMLDVIGDVGLIGKPVGSDKNNNKVTYVDLIGLDACNRKIKELKERAKDKLNNNFKDKNNFKDMDFIVNLTDFLLQINV